MTQTTPSIPATIPDSLPAGFNHQLDRVNALTMQAFKLATKHEMRDAAEAMQVMAPDGAITSDGPGDNARLIEWTVFNTRRSGRSLVQLLLDLLPNTAPADERAILTALAASQWNLFQVEDVRSGVGLAVLDAWRHTRHVLYAQRLSAVAERGEVFLSRAVTVNGLTTLTTLASPVGEKFLDTMRQAQQAGQCPDDATLAANLHEQDHIARMVFAKRPDQRPPSIPAAGFLAGGNRNRNQPCPCGSGKKAKVCCARGR